MSETLTEIPTSLPDVVLSEFTAKDAEALYDLANQNRDHIRRYGDMPFETGSTLQELRESLSESGDTLKFGVWRASELLGVARVRFFNSEIVEIGYWIAGKYCRRGYGTAAVRGLINIAAATESVRYVCADTDQENVPSKRVLEKCGFTKNHTERGRLSFTAKLTH